MSAAELTTGARFHLELAVEDGDAASYAVRIETPGGGDARFFARIARDGAVTFDDPPDALPAWVPTMLRAFVRSLYRAHADRGEAYPRRVSRWRAAP